MAETIYVDVPDDEEVDLAEYFQEQLDSNELCRALDFDVAGGDSRTSIDGISVDAVEVNGNYVHVTCSIEWSIYFGCDDMNTADVDEQVISGVRDGDCWAFEVHVAPEPRSTHEEF